jgi:uncharacterized protein
MRLYLLFLVTSVSLFTSCDASKPQLDYEAGCASGEALYCYGAGLRAYTSKSADNKESALLYMRKACDLGEGGGCSFIAATIDGSKAASETQLSQAFNLYVKGCELGDIGGCEGASELLLVGRGISADLNAAHRYHLKALRLSNFDPKTGTTYKKLLKSINE